MLRNKLLNPWSLLLLQLAALWPHWVWMARRSGDGSDEPWGVAALLVVGALVWMERGQAELPHAGSLTAAAWLSAAAALTLGLLPPMLAAMLGLLALFALLYGMLPTLRSPGALLFILLLALPVTASLNFYLGYPLRWLCAQQAAWLLTPWQVTAQGAALLWNGKTILVDAPCAGIAMLWLGLFAAALLSYWLRAGLWRTLANLVGAAGAVVLANVLRNTLLFFKESGMLSLPAWTHEGIGLLAFGLALWLIARFSLGKGANHV